MADSSPRRKRSRSRSGSCSSEGRAPAPVPSVACQPGHCEAFCLCGKVNGLARTADVSENLYFGVARPDLPCLACGKLFSVICKSVPFFTEEDAVLNLSFQICDHLPCLLHRTFSTTLLSRVACSSPCSRIARRTQRLAPTFASQCTRTSTRVFVASLCTYVPALGAPRTTLRYRTYTERNSPSPRK